MAIKKLTPQEWIELEKRALAGESNRSLAKAYGIGEATIRDRLGQVKQIKVHDAAVKVVEARKAIESLPPAMRVQVNPLADVLQSISNMAAQSAELAAKTSYRMSHIANLQASKVDEQNPDPELLRMVHGLTETANKAAYQPLELLKANKDMLGEAGKSDAIESTKGRTLDEFYTPKCLN